jgi:hypothetical protein
VDPQVGFLPWTSCRINDIESSLASTTPTRRLGVERVARCPFHRGPLDVGQGLPDVDQESSAGRGQPHVVGRAVHQCQTELPFQPLQPLAQRGLTMCLRAAARPKCNCSARVTK